MRGIIKSKTIHWSSEDIIAIEWLEFVTYSFTLWLHALKILPFFRRQSEALIKKVQIVMLSLSTRWLGDHTTASLEVPFKNNLVDTLIVLLCDILQLGVLREIRKLLCALASGTVWAGWSRSSQGTVGNREYILVNHELHKFALHTEWVKLDLIAYWLDPRVAQQVWCQLYIEVG